MFCFNHKLIAITIISVISIWVVESREVKDGMYSLTDIEWLYLVRNISKIF